MSDNWLEQFEGRGDSMCTPLPHITQPQTVLNDENQHNYYAPQFLTHQVGFLGGGVLDQVTYQAGIIPPQSGWTNNLAQAQQQTDWTDNLGSSRRALRDKAMQGGGNGYWARPERAMSMESSSGMSNTASSSVSSQQSSSQSSSIASSPQQKKRKRKGGKKKRKMRPKEAAEQTMNGRKRRITNLDVTEVDQNDGSEPMVQMTLTTYMKLVSKRVHPRGHDSIGETLPGAFQNLARQGNMADVWSACILCGARESNRTLMKAHYEAHLPTKNPMALLLGECDKIGQFGLGSLAMASEECQQASFRMSLALWHQYGTLLGGKAPTA